MSPFAVVMSTSSFAALLPEIGDPGGGIERGPNDSDWMMERFDSSIANRRFSRARRRAVLPHVVRHVTVEALVLALHR